MSAVDARTGDGIRTHDSHVGNVETTSLIALPFNGLQREENPLALGLRISSDAPLAAIVAAWPRLSAAVRARILALLNT